MLGLETLSYYLLLEPLMTWRPASCAGWLLIALFTRIAKLDPGAYDMRYARARPSIMQ